MAADPGSQVYQGREGTGEATIYQPSVNALGTLVQERAARRKQAADQQKLDLAQQEKRQKYIDDQINTNFGKYGWFQQEDRVKEIEKVKNDSTEFSFQNPYAGMGELSGKFRAQKENVNRRIARGNEYEKVIEANTKAANEDNMLDGDFIHAYQSKLISEKGSDGSYGNRDIDNIDGNKIRNIVSHPRAYKANEGIVDIANDIKNQVLTSNDSKVRATDFGLEFDENLKKYRFKVDKNGQIADNIVTYVLEQDSRVGDRIRWDIAKEQTVGNKNIKYLTEEELDAIDKNFEQIQYRNDPSIVFAERDKVRDVLNQLQQTEVRHNLQVRTPSGDGGYGENSPVNVRLERINNVRNVFDNGISPSKEGTDAVAGMVGGKFGTYPIMEARPVLYNKDNQATITPEEYAAHVKEKFKDNPTLRDEILKSAPDSFGRVGSKKVVELTVRTATKEGDPATEKFYIDLDKPEADELLNSVYETVPGSEPISNEQLYLEKKKRKSKIKSSGVNWGGNERTTESESGVQWENN